MTDGVPAVTTDPYRFDANPVAPGSPVWGPAGQTPAVPGTSYWEQPVADVAVPELATIRRRIVALFVDIMLVSAVSLLIMTVTGGFSSGDGQIAFTSSGLTAVLVWLTGPLYWVTMEATSGATLGKRLLGLRVVRRGDRRAEGGIGIGHAVVRYLLFGVDAFAVGLVGLITASVSRNNQRVGDHLARTVVVRQD
jgi:uncharacterized RDD family membrane protein YckC